MVNITKSGNTVIIDDGKTKWAFPSGSLWFHANAGNNQSVDVKLGGSRKLLLTFLYSDCNLAGQDAQTTVQNIIQAI